MTEGPRELHTTHPVDPVSIEAFENASDAFDRLVQRTPEIDRFCSASDWIFSARAAWTPQAEPWIRKGAHGYAAFLRVEDALGLRILHSFDTMWGFSCPLIGSDPARLAEEFARTCAGDEGWNFIVVTGAKPESELYHSLVQGFQGFGEGYAAYECGRMRRWQASLEGGPDGWLGRRSAKFRSSLRAALRKARSERLEIEPAFNPDPEAMDAVFLRILAVEQASWKGSHGTGLLVRDMESFYRGLTGRVARRGALRVMFLRRGDLDVGYILGGLIGQTYRGFQFSFDKRFGHLSLGNVMQYEKIVQLCEEGVQVYDLGIDMDYKRRWAETAVDTVSLAIMRL